MQRRELPKDWDAELPTFKPDPKGVAGRQASGQVLNALAKQELARHPEVRAVIQADGAVPHRRVIAALEALRTAGISRVAFAVAPRERAGEAHR